MKKKKEKIQRGRHMRKGLKKRHDDTDIDPENPEEGEKCLLTEDKRCRSLEDLHNPDQERKDMKKIVRMNSMRKAKSVDDILRDQLEEVKGVMHQNLIKIRDRNGKLDDLVNRGDTLTDSCQGFMMVSKKVQRKQKLRYWKYRILLGITVGVVGVILLVVILVVTLSQKEDTPTYHIWQKNNQRPINGTS